MNKTALIIGASRGIGLGLVKELSAQGWNVIATVRAPQRAEALTGIPGVRVERLEMTDASQGAALAQHLAGTRLDLLYLNAGVSGRHELAVNDATLEEVADLFMTNAIAPIRLAEQLLPLVKPMQGVIAFMSSVMGSVEAGPGMGMPLYGASKAALNHLARNFALGLGDGGPTVLSLHPGWVQTEMGGSEAPLDVATSCRGLVEQVTNAAGQGGHRFIDYQGKALPW